MEPFSQPADVFHGRTEALVRLVARATADAGENRAHCEQPEASGRRACFMSGWHGCAGLTSSPSKTSPSFQPGTMLAMQRSFSTVRTTTLATSLPSRLTSSSPSCKHPLVIADVQHDKIPFRIHHDNLALEIGAQFHDIILISKEFVQLILYAANRPCKNLLFFVHGGNGVVILLDQGDQLENFLGRLAGAFVSGQIGLRGVAILRGLGELVGQIISALDLRSGGVFGLFARTLRVRQLLLRVRQVFLRRGQILLSSWPAWLGSGSTGCGNHRAGK
jgi:hypothetical protein